MHKKHTEFSKILLKQESALIWVISIAFLVLAFYCIFKGFTGSLPWLAAMVGFPWTAYGVSQAMYYKKSEKENTAGGIKYDTTMEELRKQIENKYAQVNTCDYSEYDDGIDPYAGTYSWDTENINIDDFYI